MIKNKPKIKIGKAGTPTGRAYTDIRTMIFNNLSTNKIKEILRKDYKFDNNELTKSIKEMRIILKGYKLGFLGSENKFKTKQKKEPILVIEETTASPSLEKADIEKDLLTAVQLAV